MMSREPACNDRGSPGLTTVELLAALGLMLVLVSIAIPLKRWDEKRRREVELRIELRMLREAIDQYKKAFDEGKIQQKDVDQRGYPLDLDELVEGVDVADPVTGMTHKVKFLRSPSDRSVHGRGRVGEALLSGRLGCRLVGRRERLGRLQPLPTCKALDGTYYKDW